MSDYSTLCRRQKTLNLSLPYRSGLGPFDLRTDRTGIQAAGEGERNARKHGGHKRRRSRRKHIGTGEETLEVRAVEGTRAGSIARNEAVDGSRYLGRAIWRRWSGYRRWRLVEI